MTRRPVIKLLAGFKRFRERYFLTEGSLYGNQLSSGQSPKTLVIACSDSRVDPSLMASASPGDLFVIRNVANLVPPFEPEGRGLHGVSAAIEFAVKNVKVENIVILGHRQCGGIQALVKGSSDSDLFVGPWVKIAEPARLKVLAENPHADTESLCRLCERESIVVSLNNLKTFPFISAAIEERGLNIIGIYFDLEKGHLLEYEEMSDSFKSLTEET
jgi:carbonic anhydrase